MASKLSQESRKPGEFVVIVVIAVLALALGVVATHGFPGGDGDGMSSVGSDPQPSATEGAPERPTEDPEATRDPRDTWVPAEQFPGVPAIQPSIDSAAPGEPRITVRDVEAYVASGAGDVLYTDEIVSIEFLPADVVEARIDAAPGAYGGRFLCMVDLRGSYNVGMPPEVQEKIREEGRTFEITRMIAIFDARTGNLLSQAYPPTVNRGGNGCWSDGPIRQWSAPYAWRCIASPVQGEEA